MHVMRFFREILALAMSRLSAMEYDTAHSCHRRRDGVVALISVAPMMDWTDRHDRYFLRLISPDVQLYTEMITAQALIHGDRDYLLGFHAAEHPLVLQLGGSDPK